MRPVPAPAPWSRSESHRPRPRFIEEHYADEKGELNFEDELALGFTFSYPTV